MSVSEEPTAGKLLTPRQEEILRLVALGRQNKEIAGALDISEAAIESHLHHIYRRINVTNRTEAALWAWQHGLLDPPDDEP